MIEERADPATVVLDVTDFGEDALRLAVVTAYVSGFDTIVLEADRVTTAQRRTVREVVTTLVGAELLEGTGDSVTLENVLDESNLTVPDALERMRTLTTSMLEETVAALVEGDADLAQAVVERDDDVDRLWLFVARALRVRLRSPEQGAGPDVAALFDHHSVARQLERVADSAAVIARVTATEGPFTSPAADALAEPGDRLATALTEVLDSMEADARRALASAVTAREARTGVEADLRALEDRLSTLDAEHERALGRIADALVRIASHVENLGEIALQGAYPPPEG